MEKDQNGFAKAIGALIIKELESIKKGSSDDLIAFKLSKGSNPIKQFYQELMVIKAKIESIIDGGERAKFLLAWGKLEKGFAKFAEEFSALGNIKNLKELFAPSKEQEKAIKSNEEAEAKLKKVLGKLYKNILELVEKYNDYHHEHPIGLYDQIKFEIPKGKNFLGTLNGEIIEYSKDEQGNPTYIGLVYDYQQQQAYTQAAKKKYGKEMDEIRVEDKELMEERMQEVTADMIKSFGDLRTFPHNNKHLSAGDPEKESSSGGEAKYIEKNPIEVRKLEHYARMYGWVTSSGENVHRFPFVVGADQGEWTQCVRIDGDHGHPIVESGSKTSFDTYIKKDWEDDKTQKDPKRKEALKNYLRRVGYQGVRLNWKNFTWDTNVQVQGLNFTIGSSSGEGLNCLIDSIRLALGLNKTVEDIATIRLTLIEKGLAQENAFLYNDQKVLEEILIQLGQNPNDINIFFVAGNMIDNFTYNFGGGTTIYIHNAGNVHFSPMEEA